MKRLWSVFPDRQMENPAGRLNIFLFELGLFKNIYASDSTIKIVPPFIQFVLCTDYVNDNFTTGVNHEAGEVYLLFGILYPELSFLLRYTLSLSTPILQDFCKI